MYRSTNDSTGEKAQPSVAVKRLAAALLALASAQLAGCAGKPQQTTQNLPSASNTRVISGDPQGDRSAYQEMEDSLTQVRWGVIEKRGPKTAWEQFSLSGRKRQNDNGGAVAEPAAQPEPPEPQGHLENLAPVVAAPAPVAVPAPAVAPKLVIAAAPTTRPTTQPAIAAAPTTRPTTQPAIAAAPATPPIQPVVAVLPAAPTTKPVVPNYVYPETGLPIRAQELADGKVRLLWTLRNYGGTAVTSARDLTTARRSVTIAPPDLAPLVTLLTGAAGPGATVVPLPRENTIVVTCDRPYRGAVVELLAKLDVPPRQVQIAARIFEVSHDFDFQQGAQVLAKHVGTDNAQSGLSLFNTANTLQSAQTGAPFQGSVVSLMKTFEKQGISIETSFQILADAGLVRLVSSPRMTVAAGQTGYLLAGQELPIQTANLINGVLTTTSQYKPVGVQLFITPQAIGPDRVRLHTISIVSSVSGFAPLPSINGRNSDTILVNPIIDSREAETAVTVSDGDTLVISGLRMSRTTTRENKVPGLGDIPVFGWLFKNHRSQQQQTDLYFFVTPTLL